MRPALSRALSHALRRFRRDETGSITVETLLMVPILVWLYLATFVFFDVFRTQSVNIKASYTIGDLLSRETGYVTQNYMTGLFGLQDTLLNTDTARALRVTAFRYDATNDTYSVRWSRTAGSIAALTTADLANMRGILPVMPDGEIAILTHSRVAYEPVFDVGIIDFTFDEYTVTRPRFAPQLCWNSSETGTAATATC